MFMVALTAGGLVLALVVVGGIGAASSTAGTATRTVLTALRQRMCTAPTGPVKVLSPQQEANAETIVSVEDSLSAENPRAARIALMAAITESDLHNDPGGMGGAVGLFQQTPAQGWGARTQILDPAYASAQFGRHLLATPRWQRLAPWVAAQTVQRSGAGEPTSPLNPLPGQLGGNYKVEWSAAGRVYRLVAGHFTLGGCGGGPPGGVTGRPGRHGLPKGYEVPAGTPSRVRLVLRYALSKLGDRYVWAEAGPNTFDCSGLTLAAWARSGIHLLHYTVDQMHEGRRVPASEIRPGDLVLVPGSDAPGPGLPGHVGIYLGDGLVESAIDPQQGVAVQPWKYFTSGGLDAVVDPLLP